MLKIRLARIGRKNDPTFRVVVTEHTRGPKSGNHLEILGNYNPKMDNTTINGERVKHWISNGAQVSDTVHNILIKEGVIEGKKINVLPKKTPIIKEKDETAEAPAPEAEQEIKEETPAEEVSPEETPAVEEAPTEEVKEEAVAEASAEETK
ncbi:MAG: 30S ribosomal protein S16 [Candidatus Paceibacterota bacterium]